MRRRVQKAYTERDMQLYLLQLNRLEKRTLRDMAKQFKVSHGVIQRALDGNFPKDIILRARMGLLPISEVVSINGAVPAGSVTIGADQCDCGRYYISNHPRRKRCFICSPYRGKKK